MKLINKSNAHLFMVILAILFGLGFVWAEIIAEAGNAYVILFFVSIAGFVITLIIAWFKKINLKVNFRYIFFMNLMLLFTYIFELIGLQYTTSSNTSFIVQLTVLIIPIISSIVDRRLPALRPIVLGLIALIGIAIMTLDPENLSVNTGDALIVLVALSFSVYVVMVERTADNPIAIAFYFFLMGIFLYLGFALMVGAEFSVPFGSLVFLLPFIAFIITLLLTMLLQVHVAKFIRPERIAIYYCLEPITTVIAAYFILQHVLTVRLAIGGAIILGTVILASRKKSTSCNTGQLLL